MQHFSTAFQDISLGLCARVDRANRKNETENTESGDGITDCIECLNQNSDAERIGANPLKNEFHTLRLHIS